MEWFQARITASETPGYDSVRASVVLRMQVPRRENGQLSQQLRNQLRRSRHAQNWRAKSKSSSKTTSDPRHRAELATLVRGSITRTGETHLPPRWVCPGFLASGLLTLLWSGCFELCGWGKRNAMTGLLQRLLPREE